MFRRLRGARFFRLAAILPLLVSLLVPTLPKLTKDASAAGFNVKTGSYVGTGSALSISGVGFTPELIFIKSYSSAVGVIKTKDMAGATVASAGNTADASGVTIDSGGFTLSAATATVNTASIMYYYQAFSGSDCSASGTFCVGVYTGSGTAGRTINTGFQPSLVIAKSNKAVGLHFRTASMATGRTEFFSTTAANTAGAYLNDFQSNGFTAGTTDNLSTSNFYYLAFKSDPSTMKEGSYVGDGVDARNISGLGMTPNMVMIKNSTSATTNNRRAVLSTDKHYGDQAVYFSDGLGTSPNFIQSMGADTFQVGSGVNTNENGSTLYWFALGGTQTSATGSGTFEMNTGVYTGNGTSQSVTGIGFRPDFVLIKDISTGYSVFKTSDMPGDTTQATNGAISDFAGAITSIDSDGFSLGTDIKVNASGGTFHWQAFGGAYNSRTSSGASDFAVGTYIGNGADGRELGGLPFAPDFVFIKRSGAASGSFRTSAHVGDLTSKFTGSSDATNIIQSFSADGFQLGSSADSNTSGAPYRWVAFKNGANFNVGSYTGDGIVDREITGPGFQPDLVWVKHSGTQNAVQRPSTLAGDSTQYFSSLANVSGRIKSFTSSGYTVGSNEVNSIGNIYRYMAWRTPATGSLGVNVVDGSGSTVASPSFNLSPQSFPFNCINNSGNYLASASQRIRITNTTTSPGWALSIGASAGTGAYWQNGGSTQTYDYNDTGGSGCTDGADADSRAGVMTIDPSVSTIDAQSGCSSSNITKGSTSDFSEGVSDSLTLLTASSSAETDCYWDLYDVGLAQTLPAEQAADSYSINLTVTVVAY